MGFPLGTMEEEGNELVKNNTEAQHRYLWDIMLQGTCIIFPDGYPNVDNPCWGITTKK